RRPQADAGAALRPLAGLRRGGHRTLLLPSPPRSRDDHRNPPEDHRPEHRLALHQRAQEGAEGMNRREFLNKATLATGAGLLGIPRSVAAAEPPPETKRIRIMRTESTCVAPELVAEDLLRAEGFSDVQYVMRPSGTAANLLATGQVDLNMAAAGQLVHRIDV